MLGMLKGLLIQEDIQPKPSVAAPVKQAVVLAVAPTTAVQDDPKIVEALQEAIQAKTLDSYDYLKFLEAQKALEGVITDEATRFKSVFATIPKSFGVTKQKLIDTAKHYLAVLEAEDKVFTEGMELKSRDNVAGNQKKVEELDLQIQKLGEDLARLQATRTEVAAQVTKWKSEIDAAKVNFQTVCGKMQAKIEQDIKKLSDYLVG